GHAAVLLNDGRVLVAGGYNGSTLVSAELYDPSTKMWTPTGDLNAARLGLTMTLLVDGRVLAARGTDSDDLQYTWASAEIYDPASGEWSIVATSSRGSVFHTATLLLDGKVLVTGGYTGRIGDGNVLAVADLFDPATETWSRVADMYEHRLGHAATLLPSGNVLVSGGSNDRGFVADNKSSTEVFDIVTAKWTTAPSVTIARYDHTATLLLDGTVLIAGGREIVSGSEEALVVASAARYGSISEVKSAMRPFR